MRPTAVRVLMEAASDAVVSVDRDQLIRLFNRAACEMFGWSEQEALGQPLSILLPEQARDTHRDKFTGFVCEHDGWRPMAQDRGRLLGRRRDGSTFPAEVTISKVEFEGEWWFTAIVRDATQRLAFEQRLYRLSMFDPLTGLANRAQLQDRLESRLEVVTEQDAVVVLFIDLDQFKRINDALGHAAGDELLLEFGQRLQSMTRRSDLVARFGGDAFVVLARCEDAQDALEALVRRVLRAWGNPFTVAGRQMRITASAGVALARTAGTAGQTLLRDAGVALDRAKQKGRNRVEVYDPVAGGWAATRLEIERRLDHAVSRSELSVHYQPIVDLGSGEVSGFEALLRWTIDGRAIPPDEFIPVAEQTGQIRMLGAWVLRQACHDWRRLCVAAGRDVGMAVNLSVRQVDEPGLVEQVQDVLLAAGMAPEYLTLEITETFLMEDTHESWATLDSLQQLGIHLALDDFGTGFSSLSHLRRICVSSVKIDRSFMKDVTSPGSEDHTIVSAVIALTHAMGLHVTAEGIETEAQAHVLRELGADTGQGYHYSAAVPADEAVALFNAVPARNGAP